MQNKTVNQMYRHISQKIQFLGFVDIWGCTIFLIKGCKNTTPPKCLFLQKPPAAAAGDGGCRLVCGYELQTIRNWLTIFFQWNIWLPKLGQILQNSTGTYFTEIFFSQIDSKWYEMVRKNMKLAAVTGGFDRFSV